MLLHAHKNKEGGDEIWVLILWTFDIEGVQYDPKTQKTMWYTITCLDGQLEIHLEGDIHSKSPWIENLLIQSANNLSYKMNSYDVSVDI